ncbi:hypothetical protein SLEP1_g45880 [Rubroshorea leprosula]|uniref:Uncharacterized protein n=1 Tax=Rubroshorea leprosula TaxID=152421 RepID=A0AAV5LN06_9ROSI|nr:hypothetical protein SLEP1_g45880 [Rubroshorea leprosula]
MIWVAALLANVIMTHDRRLLTEANLGRKADVGAATDANKAAVVVTINTDGADYDTNTDYGKYKPGQDSFGSDTSSHHHYPTDQNPNKPQH